MQRVPTYKPSLEEALGGKPTKAEEKVLAAAKAGRMEQLRADGRRPDEADDDTRIRAGLIRFLMLGGDEDHPVHPRGVQIRSAFITGGLDFEGCETQLDLSLHACMFDTIPRFTDSYLGGLYLPGCHVPGLLAQRMRLEESLHLRQIDLKDKREIRFTSTGTIDISGAQISGQLDCSGARISGAAGQALVCAVMTVGADVFIGEGFHATGEVNLIGASINGQLSGDGGRFDGSGARALNGNAMMVGASIFLRRGFHATGEVNFTRARITGNFRFSAALIEGLLHLASTRIGEGLFLTKITGVELNGPWLQGISPPSVPAGEGGLFIDLTEAEAGVLSDDAASWRQVRAVSLSGFRYRSVQSRMTVAERVQLLNRTHQAGLSVTATGKRHFQSKPTDFDPRAYGELARAYLRQGERKAAATVLEAREDRSRDAELRRAQAEELPGSGLATLGARGRWLAMWAFKLLFGYGHRPARVFVTLIPLWLVLTWFFGTVYDKGQFAPNSDVILTSDEWQDAVGGGCPLPADATFPAKLADGCTMPLTLWTGDPSRGLPPAHAAKDYETFGPWLYAADLFLPLDTIGQTEAWAPSKDRGAWGWWGYYLRFPVQVFGWIIVAMSAAILTGLVGRRED